ncbi:FAD-dependent oxidoreductase [Chloroflexota bacterium]
MKRDEERAVGSMQDDMEEEIIGIDEMFFLDRGLITSPCQEKCPLALNCHGYISLINEGKFIDAHKMIRQKLPFPMTLGRVCDHPCEDNCRRVQMDEAVAVRDLKRFAADYAFRKGVEYVPRVKAERDEKVAVVGAGPAGLAAAYDLAREGFHVTIFEALPVAGGLMITGCPEYRLPRKIIESEIENITKLGVEIKLNHKVADISSLLKQGYKAVFVAIGAQLGAKLPIPGVDLGGVLTAISFLRGVSLREKVDLGRRVIILGGGDVAFDCARTAVRLDTEVHVACVESRDKMPAGPAEIAAAEEEGVIVHPACTFTRILGDAGRVTSVEYINVRRAECDSEGNLHIDTIQGTENVLSADTVIFAVGQVVDLPSDLPDTKDLKVDKCGMVAVDPDTLATGMVGIFSGGDAATNAGSVIQAMADGQRAALSITSYLNREEPSGKTVRQDDELIAFPTVALSEEEISAKGQRRVNVLPIPVEQRCRSFNEVLPTYSDEQAVTEASRCLRCDLVQAKTHEAMRTEPGLEAVFGEGFTYWDVLKTIKKEYQMGPVNWQRRALLHNLGVTSKRKRKAENVLLLSCGVFGLATQVVAAMKVLDHLGIEYTYLREELCCGLPVLEAGKGSTEDFEVVEQACDDIARWNLERCQDVGAKRMFHICQWCTYLAKRFLKDVDDFEVLYYPDILVRNLDKLRELKPSLPPTKVGYYEGCHLRNITFAPGVEIDWKSYRALVEVIDGLEIVDMSGWKCCNVYYEEIIEDAKRQGFSAIVTPCAACWTWLERDGSKKGMPVKWVADILAEALGEKTFEGLYISS